jgi:hypothetical protein
MTFTSRLSFVTTALTLSLFSMIALPRASFAEVYTLSNGNTLEGIAQIAPSHLDADLEGVEATNLRAVGSVVYVTYNSAGASSKGAFEAIDIADIRHPRSLSVIKYDQFEFADIAIVGDRAYVVGQENTSSHQGAVLKMINIASARNPVDMGSLALEGYAATSIRIRDGRALVSTGDNGAIEILDLPHDGLPVVRTKIPFANALFSSATSSRYYALGGADTTQFVSFDPSTGDPLQNVEIAGSETPSPARFQLKNGTAFINAEKSGFSLVDLKSFNLLSQVNLPGTGNGLDVIGDRAYLAQGEAGLYLVDVRNKRKPEVIGNLDFHHVGESTNQVRYYRDCVFKYLLVANGSGGLRIFKLGFGL